MRDSIAGDSVPSDFTNPLEVKPKYDNHGHELKNFTPLQKAFYTITKTKPTEVTRTEGQAAAMEQGMQKKFRYAKKFQAEQIKPKLTVVGRIVNGKK